MTPIKRLGFFVFAMFHAAIVGLIIANVVLPWWLGLISRTAAAMLLGAQFFHYMHEAIKDSE